MIFSIQRFLEDYFEQRKLTDVDQFAVSLANLYDRRRSEINEEAFLSAMRRVRTLFYKNNSSLNRSDFERHLLQVLDARFESKKKALEGNPDFSHSLAQGRQRLRQTSRLTIGRLLLEYQRAVEYGGIDGFWISRRQGHLKSKPESIAQGLMATSLKMFFRDRDSGLVLREFSSGVGFVDIGIVLSRVLHIVELKVLTRLFEGPAQLEKYMKTEDRREGWLVVVETRPDKLKTALPALILTKRGTIKTVTVDINPGIPSQTSK